jgi:hypothetical protein
MTWRMVIRENFTYGIKYIVEWCVVFFVLNSRLLVPSPVHALCEMPCLMSMDLPPRRKQMPEMKFKRAWAIFSNTVAFWRNGNTHHSYSVGPRFESRSRYRLFCGSFLLNPFQFIINQSCHYSICSLAAGNTMVSLLSDLRGAVTSLLRYIPCQMIYLQNSVFISPLISIVAMVS